MLRPRQPRRTTPLTAHLNIRSARLCTATTHHLHCGHTHTTTTPTNPPTPCRPNCCNPRFGPKNLQLFPCQTCILEEDSHYLLETLAQLRGNNNQLARLQNTADLTISRNLVEELSDSIHERQTALQFQIQPQLWRLYDAEGEEGVRRTMREREEQQRQACVARFSEMHQRIRRGGNGEQRRRGSFERALDQDIEDLPRNMVTITPIQRGHVQWELELVSRPSMAQRGQELDRQRRERREAERAQESELIRSAVSTFDWERGSGFEARVAARNEEQRLEHERQNSARLFSHETTTPSAAEGGEELHIRGEGQRRSEFEEAASRQRVAARAERDSDSPTSRQDRPRNTSEAQIRAQWLEGRAAQMQFPPNPPSSSALDDDSASRTQHERQRLTEHQEERSRQRLAARGEEVHLTRDPRAAFNTLREQMEQRTAAEHVQLASEPRVAFQQLHRYLVLRAQQLHLNEHPRRPFDDLHRYQIGQMVETTLMLNRVVDTAVDVESVGLLQDMLDLEDVALMMEAAAMVCTGWEDTDMEDSDT